MKYTKRLTLSALMLALATVLSFVGIRMPFGGSMTLGSMMSVGFEKVYLMMNDLNSGTSEVISTYVYTQGLLGGQLSYSTAIGMFNSVINIVLLILVNQLSKRARNVSVF